MEVKRIPALPERRFGLVDGQLALACRQGEDA
jgi:hypothetical protein